ncbi:hypothetical protein [uncultured Imperialibacter sp.]|uniref:hypothetical protein n=1 Tax=uncultured Imperialibacter sp. TaxID=1672639 RepID=UPI0030DA92EA|tara:strand:- start:3217 stop:3576 length:360 start_codon:yes stop_codon:yes gene_type:complete
MDIFTGFAVFVITVFAVGLFYWLTRRQLRLSRKIDQCIIDQAKSRGLVVEDFRYAGGSDWKDSPFPDKIRVGTVGFHGVPDREEYVRILECRTPIGKKTFWVKVIRKRRKDFDYEWLET